MHVRNRIRGSRTPHPRLSVHKTGNHIYAQLVDDKAGKTLVSASTLSKEVRAKIKSGGNVAAAKLVGELIAKRSVAAGVTQIAFDRGASKYHGRIKALAESAREHGLKF